ncbi:MAG: nucleotidyltransferase domain-containing protein [Candidatus Aenigmarchaeota archaeon]|nr:nucleotidyltransferase domain-containing protein [Candidatus Aenigmarchaeota archaeon]
MKDMKNSEMPGREFMEEARRDENVIAVIMFGSRVRGGTRKDSDVDVCLVLKRGRMDRESLFRTELKYTGIAKSDKLDISLFQTLPVFIKTRVLREGKVLLSKNDEMLYDIAFSTIKEFEEFKKYYYEYLGAVAHAR